MTIDKDYFTLAIYQTQKTAEATIAHLDICKKVIESAESADDYYRMFDSILALHTLTEKIEEMIFEIEPLMNQAENEIDVAEFSA